MFTLYLYTLAGSIIAINMLLAYGYAMTRNWPHLTLSVLWILLATALMNF